MLVTCAVSKTPWSMVMVPLAILVVWQKGKLVSTSDFPLFINRGCFSLGLVGIQALVGGEHSHISKLALMNLG